MCQQGRNSARQGSFQEGDQGSLHTLCFPTPNPHSWVKSNQQGRRVQPEATWNWFIATPSTWQPKSAQVSDVLLQGFFVCLFVCLLQLSMFGTDPVFSCLTAYGFCVVLMNKDHLNYFCICIIHCQHIHTHPHTPNTKWRKHELVENIQLLVEKYAIIDLCPKCLFQKNPLHT